VFYLVDPFTTNDSLYKRKPFHNFCGSVCDEIEEMVWLKEEDEALYDM